MTERKQNISQIINDFVFTKDLKITKTKIMRTNVNLKKKLKKFKTPAILLNIV